MEKVQTQSRKDAAVTFINCAIKDLGGEKVNREDIIYSFRKAATECGLQGKWEQLKL